MNAKKASIKREFWAGLTTFLTMLYIVAVNPAILSTPGTGMAFSGVMTATVLLCFSMTLLMGLYAKLPFAVGPGMGINAFFTFSLILGDQVPWQVALGMVFWSGVLFVLVSATPLRVSFARAIPNHLRVASAVGIGLFLAFIGLKNSGLVVADPVTFVRMGKIDTPILLSLVAYLVTIPLLRRKSPLAFIAGIATVTLLSIFMGQTHFPDSMIAAPDFESVFLKLDIWGALKLGFIPVILSLMFTDLFDSISTLVGVSHAAGMRDKDGEPRGLREGLIVDAFATLTAGLMGTSSGTAFVESAAGVEAGGRTGLTSVFTALFFLPLFFFSPLVAMIPAIATAPVLVIVGALMFRSIGDIKFQKLEEAFPAFLMIVLIPLTFSITKGLMWGFVSHGILFLLAGRRQELSLTMMGLTILSGFFLYYS